MFILHQKNAALHMEMAANPKLYKNWREKCINSIAEAVAKSKITGHDRDSMLVFPAYSIGNDGQPIQAIMITENNPSNTGSSVVQLDLSESMSFAMAAIAIAVSSGMFRKDDILRAVGNSIERGSRMLEIATAESSKAN